MFIHTLASLLAVISATNAKPLAYRPQKYHSPSPPAPSCASYYTAAQDDTCGTIAVHANVLLSNYESSSNANSAICQGCLATYGICLSSSSGSSSPVAPTSSVSYATYSARLNSTSTSLVKTGTTKPITTATQSTTLKFTSSVSTPASSATLSTISSSSYATNSTSISSGTTVSSSPSISAYTSSTTTTPTISASTGTNSSSTSILSTSSASSSTTSAKTSSSSASVSSSASSSSVSPNSTSASSIAPYSSSTSASSTLTASTTSATALSSTTLSTASTSSAPSVTSTGSASDSYETYTGDGTVAAGWPSQDQWVAFDDMFEANMPNMKASCARWGVPLDSDDEISDMKSAISDVAGSTGVDKRFILAIIMQESTGCVRVITTAYSHENPGLMQSNQGNGTCNTNSAPLASGASQDGVLTPCPESEIRQQIQDGTGGTAAGDGLQQLIVQADASDVSRYYKAARLYNGGSIDPSGDLGKGCCTLCYCSDVANRLTGWVNAASTCNL